MQWKRLGIVTYQSRGIIPCLHIPLRYRIHLFVHLSAEKNFMH